MATPKIQKPKGTYATARWIVRSLDASIRGTSTLAVLLSTRARGLMVFMVSIMVLVGFQRRCRNES
jgi:hypothetical protein